MLYIKIIKKFLTSNVNSFNLLICTDHCFKYLLDNCILYVLYRSWSRNVIINSVPCLQLTYWIWTWFEYFFCKSTSTSNSLWPRIYCKHEATKSLFDHETTYITVVFTIYVVSLPVHVAEAGSFHEVFTSLQKTVTLYRYTYISKWMDSAYVV